MIRIEENKSLKPYNTFGIDANARYWCVIDNIEQLQELIQSPLYRSNKHLILGGGSNLLFTGDYDGIVIKVGLKGIDKVEQTNQHITLKVASGENWHSLVMHAVDHNWGGIENLSLIPGTVGAAPMQNIGAYGVEIKNVIDSVEAIDLHTGAKRVFTNEECQFGYRESVFKQSLKEKYFISSVTLTLTLNNHQLNTSYGALQQLLNEQGVTDITIQSISKAVIHVRQSKLPDPSVIGNAGSFFKNPTITVNQYEALKKSYANLPSYPVDSQYVKIAAGWLIEEAGWKGKTINKVGVHPKQALVIVNYGGGSGEEIVQLATQISDSVEKKFGVRLIPEVNFIG